MKTQSPENIMLWCEELRKAGGRIVFTHGIFDLLHPMHVLSFRQSRALGTHLVVALQTDQSAREFCGSERPVMSLEERLEVLSALEMVDAVTWFDGETPESLIATLKPAVIVQSPDEIGVLTPIVRKIVALPDLQS